jgi:hypothetical protein
MVGRISISGLAYGILEGIKLQEAPFLEGKNHAKIG